MPSGSRRPHFSSNDDEFSLPLLSRGIHASLAGSSETPRKNMPPVGSNVSGVFFIMWRLYNTFSAKIKVLSRREKAATGRLVANSLMRVNCHNRRLFLIATTR